MSIRATSRYMYLRWLAIDTVLFNNKNVSFVVSNVNNLHAKIHVYRSIYMSSKMMIQFIHVAFLIRQIKQRHL
jgi:hypothetical protein